MKIVVFGGSGDMGRRVVTRALASGHSVTAFSRHPDGAGQGERLRKIAGDVRNSADVSHIVEGQDAVVVTLGAGLRKSDLLERAIENIMISMRRFGVRRIVALGPAGALHGIREASRDQSLPTKLVMQVFVLFVIKNLMEQQRLMQRAIASSGLDYTIVNPPRLLEGAGRGRYRVRDHVLPPGGTQIAYDDGADFIVKVLNEGSHIRESPTIAW